MGASNSPTQLTLRKMRKDGYTAAVVEKWNHHVGIRQDLFGFIDVIAIGENETIAIQCTSYSGVSGRIKKIESDELAEQVAAVRKAGWRILVHGWRKPRHRWECREIDIS